MAESIRDIRVLPAAPSVAFSITPQPVSVYSYTLGGTTFPYSSTPPSYQFSTNTTLTFTSNINFPYGVTILEYLWNFGDGIEAYGATVDHVYAAASPETRVTLCVTDNYRRKVCAGRVMNLFQGTSIILNLSGPA